MKWSRRATIRGGTIDAICNAKLHASIRNWYGDKTVQNSRAIFTFFIHVNIVCEVPVDKSSVVPFCAPIID